MKAFPRAPRLRASVARAGDGVRHAAKTLIASATVVAFLCTVSAETTINVDFNRSSSFSGTYSGTAAAGDTGTLWNGLTIGSGPLVASFVSGTLVSSTGLPTGVTVSLGNYQTFDAGGDKAVVAPALMSDFAYQQTLGPGGPNSTFAINNLDRLFTYDLYLYAQNAGYANTATIFTIDGISQTAFNSGNIGTFTRDINYVLFSGLVPNATGTISGTFNDVAVSNNAAFNGLQIVQRAPGPPPPPPVPPKLRRTGVPTKWSVTDSVLVFNEIHYHPADEEGDTEWVELRSLQGVDVDISGWRLEGGIEFQFPPGTITRGRGFVVVAANPGHASLTGAGARGPFSGQLDNDGGELRLVNNSGRVMDRVNYSDGGDWPAGPDGSGATLAKVDEEFADAGATNWTTSATRGGSPGALNFPAGERFPGDRVVFNEISAAADPEFTVELLNAGNGSLDLAGFKIISSAGPSFTLPAQIVARGEVTTLTAVQLGFAPAAGERLFLFTGDGVEFDDAREVTSRLRGRTATARWGFPTSANFGTAANTFLVNSDVVINEIMYHPHAGQLSAQEQWLELHNRGTTAAQLGGWKLRDGIDFTFPAGTSLAPGQYLLVTDNPGALASRVSGVPILGPFVGKLSHGGERVQLVDGNTNLVDEVSYFDGGRWPESADGGGSSLERRSPFSDPAAPETWAGSNETLRGQWRTVTYTLSAAPIGTDPTQWNEFIFGLLAEGSFLIDDISVKEVNVGNRELIQNGTFESGAAAPIWRFLGTHRRATVVPDPDSPGNKVLRVDATGYTEHLSNHAETTLKSGSTYVAINNTNTPTNLYTISFRARWRAGCNLLHTRLYFNRLARKTALEVPVASGTPGAPNSASVANPGPTYRHLTHEPAIPPAGQVATVSVVPSDPHGLGALSLFYAVNGGAFATTAMSDPDKDGIFAGSIPAQLAGAKVQFYVEAQDTLGATAFFPAAGPDSRAIVAWADGQAGPGPAQNLRIAMLPADVALLHNVTNVLSNDPIGTTVIYREKQIAYDVGVWLKGSERGRAQDIRVGFNLRFPPDAPFLGAHQRIAIDRSGAGDEFGQKEMLINHAIGHSGDIPGSHADLIRVIAPRSQNTSPAMLFKARYSDEFLDNQYVNGGDGTLFEYELIYVPLTTNIPPSAGPHWVEGLKIPYPSPDDIRDEAVKNLGANPELYRWHYLIKNNRQRDDYSHLISAVGSIGLPPGAQFLSETRAKLDVDQWLRTFAVETLFGINDTYVTGGLGHNAVFYIRPSDGKMLLFPWDMDFTFSLGTTSSIAPAPALQKLFADPAHKRTYYGHLLDIMNTSFNTAYMTPWAQHYNTFLPGQNLTQHMSYISARESSARSQINSDIAPVTFAITTNGGQVSTPFATVQGTGWVNVREIRLAGSAEPLSVTWTGTTSFQVTVPLAPGTNTIALQAIASDGAVIGSATITITNTGTTQAASAANLAISEVMYHPAAPNATERAAGYNFADAEDEFEFIELLNISTAPVSLAGSHFADAFVFALPSRVLAPGERLIIARNPAAFAVRYPSVPSASVAGPFTTGKLSDGGETITLLDAGGAVIHSFAYGDAAPWPDAADGEGLSLVLIRPERRPNLALARNWRHSTIGNGNPGTSDATTFEAWKSAHGIASETADPDGDGSNNFLEYSHGMNPQVPDSAGVDTMIDATGHLVLEFTRRIGADDIVFTPLTSTDLATWLPDGGLLEYFGATYNADGSETISYRVAVPAAAEPRRFLRVQASGGIPP